MPWPVSIQAGSVSLRQPASSHAAARYSRTTSQIQAAVVLWNRNLAIGGSWMSTVPFSSTTCVTRNIVFSLLHLSGPGCSESTAGRLYPGSTLRLGPWYLDRADVPSSAGQAAPGGGYHGVRGGVPCATCGSYW